MSIFINSNVSVYVDVLVDVFLFLEFRVWEFWCFGVLADSRLRDYGLGYTP